MSFLSWVGNELANGSMFSDSSPGFAMDKGRRAQCQAARTPDIGGQLRSPDAETFQR